MTKGQTFYHVKWLLSHRSSDDSEPIKEYSPLELAEMKTGRRIGNIHRAAGIAKTCQQLYS